MAEPAPSLEQEREALSLFRALIDCSEAEQQQRLDTQCQESPWVAQRVRAMLAKTPLTVGERMLRMMDLPSAKSPAQFGPFRVTGLLAEGGMARVVRGVRATARSEQHVAIKYIPPDHRTLDTHFSLI